MGTKLRIGLLLDSISLPAWVFTAIERLVGSDYAEVVLVVLKQSRPVSNSLGRMVWQDPGHGLYHIFNFIDEKLFLRGPRANARVDASAVLCNVTKLEVKPVGKNGEHYLCAADVEAIRSYRLDILVKFGLRDLQGDVLSVATYGTWCYRWGDPRKTEDGLIGFWEAVRGWPETGAALQRLGANREHNWTLFESWFFTYPYSPARNRNYILWSAASFLPRQVERLQRLGGEQYFKGLKNQIPERLEELNFNGIPSNPLTLWIMIKLALKNILEVYQRSFYRERWELLFSLEPGVDKDLPAFQKISPPKDRFWADPHVVYEEPNYYVFVEEYLYRTQKGHISVIELDRTGKYKPSVPVLQKEYHLSFPFVFNRMGRYYMIPESSEKNTIDLYECIEFPQRWQHKIVLMKNVKAVDTTVVYEHGKWWLFTAIAEQEAAAPQVELFLFFSNELFTDQWIPHPMNPVVSDVKRARGAGRIFLKDGKLLRPSQDCSVRYGYGFDLNEIVALSETEYHEERVDSVRPDLTQKIIATHTYANLGSLTVVDALTRPWKWAN